MAYVAPIVAAAGAVFQGFSQAQSQSSAANAQAQAANYNAQISYNNAIAARQAAAANAKQQMTVNFANQGRMLAGMAANGYDVGTGTPLMLLSQEVGQGELAKANMLYQGETQAMNYQNQAAMQSQQAADAFASGSRASSGSMIGGIFNGIGAYNNSQAQRTRLTSSYDGLMGGSY